MRAQGMTLQAIADRLNAEGVPTVRGGAKWRHSSVQAAVGYRRLRRFRSATLICRVFKRELNEFTLEQFISERVMWRVATRLSAGFTRVARIRTIS